jgi:hypothetical protein
LPETTTWDETPIGQYMKKITIRKRMKSMKLNPKPILMGAHEEEDI